MDYSLTWDLVWHIAVHPNYIRRKQEYANRLHRLVVEAIVAGETSETHLCGIMEVLTFLSEYILRDYGYATRWFLPRIRVDRYYPLRIRALALDMHYFSDDCSAGSNPLAGIRV